MNTLIAYLKDKGTLSIPRLRATYRALVMKTHPDVSKGGGGAFVRLQAEYEQAVRYILDSSKTSRRHGRTATPANCRKLLLSHLYLFSLRFPTPKAQSVLSRTIEVAGVYDSHVRNLLIAYQERFFSQYPTWRADDVAARIHASLLTAIKQLACYYQNPTENSRRLFLSVIDDLSSQVRWLDHLKGATLRDFCGWLKREADRGSVFMFDTMDAMVR